VLGKRLDGNVVSYTKCLVGCVTLTHSRTCFLTYYLQGQRGGDLDHVSKARRRVHLDDGTEAHVTHCIGKQGV
jgi:hypothetical protein